MAKMMMTIQWDKDKAPTLKNVAAHLKLSMEDFDKTFGVIAVAPERNLYAVMVEENKIDSIDKKKGLEGPYSNPPIEPFGPE